MPFLPPIIFDLDGTLVQSWEFNERLYRESLTEVLGAIPYSQVWSSYRNVTDSGVLQQIIEDHGVSQPEVVRQTVKEVFLSKVTAYLAAGGTCSATEGARALLEWLRSAGHPFGIATGGWAHTAKLKLQHAGLWSDATHMVTGDDGIVRAEIMSSCLRKIAPGAQTAIYFGDAVWDQKAARSLGWDFIGIGPSLQGLCDQWHPDLLSWLKPLQSMETAKA